MMTYGSVCCGGFTPAVSDPDEGVGPGTFLVGLTGSEENVMLEIGVNADGTVARFHLCKHSALALAHLLAAAARGTLP